MIYSADMHVTCEIQPVNCVAISPPGGELVPQCGRRGRLAPQRLHLLLRRLQRGLQPRQLRPLRQPLALVGLRSRGQ